MQFLIQYESDNSLCIVEECDMISDSKTVKKGDKIAFFYSNTKWNGQIIKKSGKSYK